LVIALISVFAAGHFIGLRLNMTPSYPLGLWRAIPPGREVLVGDTVLICPPPSPTFAVALERGYLVRGVCPGWMSPLIKTVAAVAGQRVEIGSAVLVDGKPVPISDIHHTDASGRLLNAWPGGRVPPDQVFLLSSYAGSYDSRYFGPVPIEGLLGLAIPVITFEP
jgi:conjugative transfer signal peptidase TraF